LRPVGAPSGQNAAAKDSGLRTHAQRRTSAAGVIHTPAPRPTPPSGGDFDPNTEETTFRVAVTDHASHVLGPIICRTVLPRAGKVSFDLVTFGDQTFDAIEKGRFDLLLSADDGFLPPRFESEIIFEDGFGCVAANDSNYPHRLTFKRSNSIWRHLSMARSEVGNRALKVLSPPEVLGRFRYLMAGHPHMNTNAMHLWLRSEQKGVSLLKMWCGEGDLNPHEIAPASTSS
jgi:hypothetical protein